jgi:hypothetical protein
MREALSRGLLVIIGACAIVWALSTIEVYRRETPIVDVARRARSGEKFNEVQLSAARKALGEGPSSARIHSASLDSLALVSLLLAEEELKEGKRAPTDLADLQLVITTALAASPTNSFAWLVGAWIKSQREAVGSNLSMLRMSYRTGPNEGWISAMRIPVALALPPSLSGELTEQALTEFGGLVRSGQLDDAANILAGPGWVIREQLLERTAGLDEDVRRGFARVLRSKDIDVKVYGVEMPFSRRF